MKKIIFSTLILIVIMAVGGCADEETANIAESHKLHVKSELLNIAEKYNVNVQIHDENIGDLQLNETTLAKYEALCSYVCALQTHDYDMVEVEEGKFVALSNNALRIKSNPEAPRHGSATVYEDCDVGQLSVSVSWTSYIDHSVTIDGSAEMTFYSQIDFYEKNDDDDDDDDDDLIIYSFEPSGCSWFCREGYLEFSGGGTIVGRSLYTDREIFSMSVSASGATFVTYPQ